MDGPTIAVSSLITMYILGLRPWAKARGTAQDGILIAATEEERFTRIKHEGCFSSPRHCLLPGQGRHLAGGD